MATLTQLTPPNLLAEVIAIDGPGGSGKSSTARELARILGFKHLDSGALYRSVAHLTIVHGIDITNPNNVIEVALQYPTTFVDGKVFVGEIEVTEEIRYKACSDRVSAVSAIPEVRAMMHDYQMSRRQLPGLVPEGRDMRKIFDAENGRCSGYFITAEVATRAARRFKDQPKDQPEQTYAEIVQGLQKRDRHDTERSVSPFVRHPCSMEIDNTDMNRDQVVRLILTDLIRRLKFKEMPIYTPGG